MSKLNNRRGQPQQLGDAIAKLMAGDLQSKCEKFEVVAESWDELVPPEVRGHCRIAGISSGQVRIAVDSPAYLYQMRLVSSELLPMLQQLCPMARFRKIDCFVG
ncbi:MAG: DUF721 domain-containing protein [Sedimentisphaerales bacterium]|nr:DUF721 domain-containing protein [Sedimentisphaerales bacterium]